MSGALFQVSVFVAKPAIVLLFLLVLFRLLGKRTSAQLNVYDLAMIVALSNAVQNAMTAGRGELWVGLAASASLVLVSIVFTRVAARGGSVQRVLLGEPIVLINNGRILRKKLRREILTEDEIMEMIRSHGLSGPSEVAMAVLEIDGTLSIVPK